MNNKYLEKIAEIGEELQLRSKYRRKQKKSAKKDEMANHAISHVAEKALHKMRKRSQLVKKWKM